MTFPKLVAIDLDGTLLDSVLTVDPETVEFLQNLEKSGVHVIVATGRTWVGAQKIIAGLGLIGLTICYNGGLIYSQKNGVLAEERIELDLARNLISCFQERNLFYKIYADDIMYVPWMNQETREFISSHGVYWVQKTEDCCLQVPPNMMVVIENEKTCSDLQETSGKRWGGSVNITRSHKRSLEFLPLGVSKGSALARLASCLGIDQRDCVAMGNEMNDLEMLHWAGIGIAMANSPLALQESAVFVTESNDNQGVLKALLKMFPLPRREQGNFLE